MLAANLYARNLYSCDTFGALSQLLQMSSLQINLLLFQVSRKYVQRVQESLKEKAERERAKGDDKRAARAN